MNGKLDSGCSGTVLYKDAVLTAGHCVANGSGSWYNNLNFHPAQYLTPENYLRRPYGTFTWRHVTTYSSWLYDGDRSYDMAVVLYYPNGRWNIADYVGHAGMYETDGGLSTGLMNTAITGYPGDKGGSEMWTPGICGNVFEPTWPWSYRIDHFCDTYGGNSGSSSLMEMNGYIRGIHVAHYTNGSANIALLMNGAHFSNAFKWAGR